MSDPSFLPGVPRDHILARMERGKGKELESKFNSPDSSSFLAVNTIGWFIERRSLLPALPGVDASQPVLEIEVEYEARLPWPGGTHPQLDAAIITPSQLVGIEAKRLEPFRDAKKYELSLAYDRPLWSEAMEPYRNVCRRLRDGNLRFDYLDASQLVKHAFGLATRGARRKLAPVLVYLFAEPAMLHGRAIDPAAFKRHRAEIADFASMVSGGEVSFFALSYREWLQGWDRGHKELAAHADAVLAAFGP